MLAHRRSPQAPVDARRGEAGETLIEILTTVVVMGLGFTALLGGIFGAVKVAQSNQDKTKASITVQAWAEGLQQPANAIPAVTSPGAIPQDYTTYRACAGPATYGVPQSSSGALPAGYSARVVKVELFSGYSGGKAQFNQTQAACYANPLYSQRVSRDGGLQQITIEVASPAGSGQAVDTLVIVKRDQRCPQTFDNADLGPC